MIKEFKTFIARGNVLDLAVGVVVGGAFSKIVTSLVDDIIMPLVGLILGGLDFSSLSIKVGKAKIMYGSFIQNIVDFLIVAFCIFLMVKAVNKLTKKIESKKETTTPLKTTVLIKLTNNKKIVNITIAEGNKDTTNIPNIASKNNIIAIFCTFGFIRFTSKIIIIYF